MLKESTDNLSVVLLAFKNFQQFLTSAAKEIKTEFSNDADIMPKRKPLTEMGNFTKTSKVFSIITGAEF